MSEEVEKVSQKKVETWEDKKKRRKVLSLDSEDEGLESLKESIVERRLSEEMNTEIDNARIDLERSRADEDSERHSTKEKLEKKHLRPEEAKIELKHRKYFVRLEESKTMLRLLSSPIK